MSDASMISFYHRSITMLTPGSKYGGGAVDAIYRSFEEVCSTRTKNGCGRTAERYWEEGPKRTAASASCVLATHMPAQPLLRGASVFGTMCTQYSQCTGDIGVMGDMIISIASPGAAGISCAATVCMHKIPKKRWETKTMPVRTPIFIGVSIREKRRLDMILRGIGLHPFLLRRQRDVAHEQPDERGHDDGTRP